MSVYPIAQCRVSQLLIKPVFARVNKEGLELAKVLFEHYFLLCVSTCLGVHAGME